MLKELRQEFIKLTQDKIIFSVFIFGSWLVPLTTALLLGMRNPLGITQAVLIYNILAAPLAIVLGSLREHSFKKAEESELKLEDDILLQAIAFSQSALWIYLNVVPIPASFSIS